MTDDEYTCLMIMAEGQNLIRMRDTRWFAPLNSLEAKGWCKPIGNENFVITQQGTAALAGHEETLEGGLRDLITIQGKTNSARQAVHSKMQEALGMIVDAARMSALTTGQSEKACCDQIIHELIVRSAEALK